MSQLSTEELDAAHILVELAIAEDLGDRGDITSLATIPADAIATAVFVARSAGVLAGLPVAELVAAKVDARLRLEHGIADGERIAPGDTIAMLSGPLRSILAAERTSLNFMQRMSGVATLTRAHVDAVTGYAVQVLDTRKTIPGWRRLDKYAVRVGGGTNHRIGLFDAILIKDNHIAGQKASTPDDQPVRRTVQLVRHFPGYAGIPVEVEVDSLDQLREVLPARPEIVLLDNMPPTHLREAVTLRNQHSPGTRLEASGGVNLKTIRGIAETGVDRISVGAITHSATALDIALDFLK